MDCQMKLNNQGMYALSSANIGAVRWPELFANNGTVRRCNAGLLYCTPGYPLHGSTGAAVDQSPSIPK